MDNRIFNINGSTKEFLTEVLELAFKQSGHNSAVGYRICKEKGFIVYWHEDSGMTKFPSPSGPRSLAMFVWDWLNSPDARAIDLTGWDASIDHDGDNGPGWRVYCEGWGHVVTHSAFIAITPAVMWYGK